MKKIDADALVEHLKFIYPAEFLKGITSQELFRRLLAEIENAPDVSDGQEGYINAE